MKHLFEKPRLRNLGNGVWSCMARARHRAMAINGLGQTKQEAYRDWERRVNDLRHQEWLYRDPAWDKARLAAIQRVSAQKTLMRNLTLRPGDWT